jgi:hypothetical protein
LRISLTAVQGRRPRRATVIGSTQRSHVDRPLLQNRKTKKIVTRSVQQLTVDSVIA